MSLKAILVTGCSAGGIGAAISLALARRGHHVVATARTPSKIPDELSSLSNVTILGLDVTSDESVAGAVAAVSESGRQLDVLLNNAGVGYTVPVLDMDIGRVRELYETNVWGSVRVIQAFAPLLIASHGRVVNLSTCGSITNTPWISAYSSSKAALNTISDTLRLELAPFGVSVVTILAGTVETKFHANHTSVLQLPPKSRYAPIQDIISGWASGTSKPQGCSPDEFAEKILDQIVGKSKSGTVLKGPFAWIIGFLSKWCPQSVSDAAMTHNQGIEELSKFTSQGD